MNIHSLIKIGAWLFVFYLVYCGLLFVLQRSVLFPRNQIPFSQDLTATPAGLEKFWLNTEYGNIEAWFLSPLNADKARPAPAVIFGHGNAELIDDWPEALKNFSRMGIGLLLVEYPGYGRSSGSPSEQSIRHVFAAAYDALVSRKTIDPTRIVLFGRSLGGGAVCALARERPSAGLILMSTFTSVQSMAAKFGVPAFLVRDRFNNLGVIKHYAGPILFIHGKDDRIVPYSHSVKLHRAAKNSSLITYRAGHNDCPPNWNNFWKDIDLFLKDNRIL